MLTPQDVEDAVVGFAAADRDSLADHARHVRDTARRKGLTVLAASLDVDTVVFDDEVTLDQALDAAAACGAVLLYLNHRTVNAAAVLAAAGDHLAEADHRRLRTTLDRIDGWTRQVEVGFAHGGVVNLWSAVAAWSEPLEQLTDTAADRVRTARWSPEVDDEEAAPQHLPENVVRRWVDTVAADPGFRRATWRGHQAAARGVPGLTELLGNPRLRWHENHIVSAALELVRDQVEQQEQALLPRRAELAARLAADPGYAACITAAARKRYAAEWMVEHADGLRLSADWVGELVALAKKTPTGQLSL